MSQSLIPPTAVYRYQLPLQPGLRLAHGLLKQREGLLLQFATPTGFCWGEAAPLPSFSRETWQQALAALQRWQTGQLDFHQLPASVQFALEMGQRPWPTTTAIDAAVLVTPGNAERLNNLPAGSTVKLKLGQQSIADDVHWFQQLRNLRPDCLLRLDCNRQWKLSQAIEFAESVGCPMGVEFIEEPCQSAAESCLFAAQTDWPLAWDESLLVSEFPDACPQLVALVLKPMLLGSFQRMSQLADFASQHQLKVIISGCFESNLSQGYLQFLARRWGAELIHGLDTLNYLAADLIVSRSSHQAPPLIHLPQLEKLC